MLLTARLIALVALALAPALVIQGYNEYALRSAREATVRADAIRQARAAAEDLEQIGDSVRQALGFVSQEEVVRQKDRQGCRAYLAEATAQLPGVILLAVTEPDGSVVCNSLGSAPDKSAYGERAYLSRTITSGAFVVGNFVQGFATGKNSIHFAQPLRDRTGAITGVVLASIDLAWLAERLARSGLAPDTALSVIDSQGTVLARVPDHADWVGRQIAPARLATIAESIDKARDTIAWDGRQRVVGVVHPTGALAPLTVSVGRDREAVFADIDAATRRGAILILLGGAFAFIGAVLGGRLFIRRPMQRLLGAAHAWRMGALGTRTGLSGSSEFGRLGEAFDAMAAALQRHEGELKAEVAHSKALQEQQSTMLHELNHRVKNTLAIVQSLARQSRGGEEQAENLEGRILALSKTHDLLTRDDWSGASLREILENELAPYRVGAEHLTLTGPAVNLPPRYVLALGMTFHELTTNAAKYGALSRAEGRVHVGWSLVRGESGTPHLRLDWQESGGPPVGPPKRRGFGSRLISGGINRELAGAVRFDFEPGGLHCRIDVPLEPAGPVA
ncbi:hypothetical protein OPKNFCMD_5269 [Methylobacterium crusticola]|uniref:histidine kinase n=1 Tax=Methylobacterium crusticola TaxID=1697972 RepID=A0ABQ4R4I3_9HYPH|nr:HWE histidine kinase domain-containing protein [Methylobacterium crusticola]GJD52503.1 hypothetical protein OPKNFCMD_5269 [Methylobacterium crusticola]